MPIKTLTKRQKDVLEEVCKGKSNKEIARSLSMAESTVKIHLTEIFKFMGVHTRSQAMVKVGDFSETIPVELQPLSDLTILKTFIDTTFSSPDTPWNERIILFGQSLEKKIRNT